MTHPPTILIRPSSDADLPSLHSLYSHYVLTSVATFEEEPPSLAAFTDRRTAVLSASPPLPYLVAIDSLPPHRVCGYAYASTYRPRTGYRYTVESHRLCGP